jgi:3'-5' exonuclease
MNLFVFDIETVPDTDAGRKIYDLEHLSDEEVANVMFAKCRQDRNGSEFLPLHLHRIVAISAVFRRGDSISVWSLGEEDASEQEIVQRFFDGIERFGCDLVSWNGSGFDLPVLHYRALKYGISGQRYWDTGQIDKSTKFNNYIGRYQFRHIDVMDVIALYQPRAFAPLDQVATMCGFPGKMGMSGDKVWQSFQDGDIKGIRNYCETDVLNTYLVFLNFQLMRGALSEEGYIEETERLIDFLTSATEAHFLQFLDAWKGDEF